MTDDPMKLLEECKARIETHEITCNRFKCDCGADELLSRIDRYLATGGCKWLKDFDGIYSTGCNQHFVFEDGGPVDNKFKFCYHCGKDIVLPPLPKKG